MDKKFDVYGLGNPLVDIVVKVGDEEFSKLGLKKGTSSMMNSNEFKRINRIIANKDKTIGPAGSCANTMMALANFGCISVFAGKIGRDEAGMIYEKGIASQGVISDLVKDKGMTGSCISMVTPDSERTMVFYLGACNSYSVKDIRENNVLASKFVHIEGYQLDTESQKKAVLHLIKIANNEGIKISFDLADPLFVKRHNKELPGIIKKCDIIFANEDEARELTGVSPEKAVRMIESDIVFIKKGVKGSVIKDNDKVIKIRSYVANAIDTTGAGDIYAAGVLYGLSRGYDTEHSGKIASYAAAKMVEQMGTRFEYSMKQRISWIVNHVKKKTL